MSLFTSQKVWGKNSDFLSWFAVKPLSKCFHGSVWFPALMAVKVLMLHPCRYRSRQLLMTLGLSPGTSVELGHKASQIPKAVFKRGGEILPETLGVKGFWETSADSC